MALTADVETIGVLSKLRNFVASASKEVEGAASTYRQLYAIGGGRGEVLFGNPSDALLELQRIDI